MGWKVSYMGGMGVCSKQVECITCLFKLSYNRMASKATRFQLIAAYTIDISPNIILISVG